MKVLISFLMTLFVFLHAISPALADEKGSVTKFKETAEGKSAGENKVQEATTGLYQVLAQFFLAGLITSLEEGDFKYLYKELKKEKKPALPTIRVDVAYQYVFNKTNVLRAKAEGGYLMIGLDASYEKYWQKSPKEILDVFGGHFLLRSYLLELLQVNLALGAKYLKATSAHKGFEFGFPLYVFFGDHIYWDVLPYMAFMPGYRLYDMGSGINFKYGMLGGRVGYKMINVNKSYLHGPDVGLFFQW